MRLYRSRKHVLLLAILLVIAAALAIMLNVSGRFRTRLGDIGAVVRDVKPRMMPPSLRSDEDFAAMLSEDTFCMLKEGQPVSDVRKMLKERVLSRPHAEDAWIMSAWFLAYEFCSKEENSELRWECLDEAICWLRDEGLKYNPNSAKIMKEIAWIYFHKIGRDTDPDNNYYKHRWALLMNSLLGPSEMQDIPGIVAAPKELSVLLADPDVAKALSHFKLSPPEPDIQAIVEAEGLQKIPRTVATVLLNPENAEAWRKVRCFVARRVLTDVYKFNDPNDSQDTIGIMLDMERTYGKFDWRLPEPHAIYWAIRSAKALDRVNSQQDDINQLMNDYNRMTLFSLQESMRRGIISYLTGNPEEPMITACDLSKVQPLRLLYHEILAEDRSTEGGGATASMRDGHILFLQESMFDLYFSGYEDEAWKCYRELNDCYDKPNPHIPMEDYCVGRVKELVDMYGTEAKVRTFVDGCITKMLFYYCTNHMDEARKWEKLAREAWKAFRAYDEKDKEGLVRRSLLPTWEDILRARIISILRKEDKSFPSDLVPVLAANLGIKDVKTLDITADFGEGIVPKIEPSSPPPK